MVVVGSGAAGGMAVRKLTEAGLDVLLLEAGPDRTQPGGDAPEGRSPPAAPPGAGALEKISARAEQMRLVSEVLGQAGSEVASALAGQVNLQRMIHLRARDERSSFPRQPVQVESPAFGRDCAQLYIDDVDNPYFAPSGQPYHWIRGRQLGGRTQTWKRMTPRLSQDELEAPKRDGHGQAWPLDYRDLRPHYEHAERVLRVVGAVEAGAEAYPDALPARPMTTLEREVARTFESVRPGVKVTLSPYASPFGPGEEGDVERRVSHYDQGGHPAHDCSVRHSIWHAKQTGRLTIRTDAVVRHVLWDAEARRATGVQFVDRSSKQAEDVEARVVVLCASALESTRILLNSKSSAWPDGMGNSSGALGRYLHDHMFGVGAVGMKNEPGQAEAFPPILVPCFRNRSCDEPAPGFIRGYQIAGYFGAIRGGPLRRWRQTLTLSCHGEVPPRRDNRIELDPSMVDAWGVPVPRIFFRREDNDRAMCRDMLDSSVELLERAGYEILLRSPEPLPPGASIHEAGTARMGEDPKTSVLDSHCRSWDVPNLFVTDGASFPTAAHQNPMLTIMALTSRACERIVSDLEAGHL